SIPHRFSSVRRRLDPRRSSGISATDPIGDLPSDAPRGYRNRPTWVGPGDPLDPEPRAKTAERPRCVAGLRTPSARDLLGAPRPLVDPVGGAPRERADDVDRPRRPADEDLLDLRDAAQAEERPRVARGEETPRGPSLADLPPTPGAELDPSAEPLSIGPPAAEEEADPARPVPS